MPTWCSLENLLKLVVLLLAMYMHYTFIMDRILTANKEALEVLKDLPDSPGVPVEKN